MHRIKLLESEVNEFYSNFRVTSNLLELRNLLQVADLIVRSAMKRKNSVGLHYNVDHPEVPKDSRPTILSPFEM